MINFKIQNIWKKKTQEKIFFLHIPKCGGTSIDFSIENSIYFENKDKQHFNLDFKACHEATKNLSRPQLKRDLLYYLMASDRYRYISGHFAYSAKANDRFGKDWHFVTLLREPVSRWFSLYFFNKYKKGDHFKVEDELEDYLKTQRAIMSGQTYLNLLSDNIISQGDCLNARVEHAIDNLKNFSVLGILENLEFFSQDFNKAFGISLEISKRNTNPLDKARQKEKVSDDIKSQVRELCKSDTIIYEAAKEIICGKR